MKVKKQIVTTEEIELESTGITLLSIDEYIANKDMIPPMNGWYWLRSSACYPKYVAIVITVGSISRDLVCANGVVRPALKICNLESSSLSVGDKFELAGCAWTILTNDLVLCDEGIGKTCFREDYKATDANDYEKSDIKKWLYDWAKENGIEFNNNL